MTLIIALLSDPPRSTKIFANQNKQKATYLSQAIALPCVSMALRVTAMTTPKMMFYFIAGCLCLQSILESMGQDSYVAYETQSKWE